MNEHQDLHVYDDYKTTFTDLLAKDNYLLSLIQIFKHSLLQMYKTKHNLSESCLKDLFSVINSIFNLRSQSDFRVPGINTVFRMTIQLGFLDQ